MPCNARAALIPDLYTYHSWDNRGLSKRIHLRIEPDGQGILFVDVTDAIHLNQTAAQIAKWALDGEDRQLVVRRLRARFRGGSRIEEDVRQTYALVDHVRKADGCPTCGVDFVQQRPLFSTRARAPYKADLALTYGCNNACGHCYNAAAHLGPAPVSPEDWERVLTC